MGEWLGDLDEWRSTLLAPVKGVHSKYSYGASETSGEELKSMHPVTLCLEIGTSKLLPLRLRIFPERESFEHPGKIFVYK